MEKSGSLNGRPPELLYEILSNPLSLPQPNVFSKQNIVLSLFSLLKSKYPYL
jgi:hypothetical protein